LLLNMEMGAGEGTLMRKSKKCIRRYCDCISQEHEVKLGFAAYKEITQTSATR